MNKIKVPLWITTLSVFLGLFVCNYLYSHSNFLLNNFNDRTIGIAVLSGINIAARSTFYLKLIFVFNVIFFGLIKILLPIQKLAENKLGLSSIKHEGDKIFVLSISSIFILLFHYINGSEIFVSTLDILKIILLLNFFIYLAKLITKNTDTILFNLINNDDLVNLSFLLPLVPFFMRWLIINGSFIFNNKFIPFYILLWFVYWSILRLISIFWDRKKIQLHIISILKSSIPLLFLPVSIVLSNEIQYSFSHILNWSAKNFALANSAVLLVLSLIIYIFNKAKRTDFNYSKFIFFPILIATVAVFNLHSNFLDISYLDIFHNGENLISNQQFFEFNKIPFINIYPTHGFSYLLSQMAYSFLNGYEAFSPWLLEWLPKIFEILLLYFALSKITSHFFATITVVFMPIIGIFGGQAFVYGYSKSIPTTYYLTAFLTGLLLVSTGKKINFKSSLLIWGACLFTTAWRIDFGIASFISVIIIQLISILGTNEKHRIKLNQLKIMFKSLVFLLIVTIIILFTLSKISSTSLIDIFNNVFQFVKFQGQAQGLQQVINTYTPIAMFQYFILPATAVFYISKYIYGVLIKKSLIQQDYKKFLVYIAIFSLVVFVRSFQRQTLSVLGYNPYLFVLLILSLPIFLSQKKNKISIIYFVVGLFIYQLVLPNANVVIKAGQMIQLYNWKNKETRVHVNDYQYKSIANFINSNLGSDQTFVDLSSSPLLYVVTNREFINYFIPNAYYTSDIIQQDVVDKLKIAYVNNHIPLVILKQPIPDANSIDGVPNEMRSYKIYEYIYKNYRPIGYVDGYMVWTSTNFNLKNNQAVTKVDHIIYNVNLAKLPYYWGQFDNSAMSKSTIIQSVIDKPNELSKKSTKSIRINNISKNVDTAYIHFRILSNQNGYIDIDYGESSHIRFELVQSDKPNDYLVRISSQYDWSNELIKSFKISSTENIRIEKLDLRQEK